MHRWTSAALVLLFATAIAVVIFTVRTPRPAPAITAPASASTSDVPPEPPPIASLTLDSDAGAGPTTSPVGSSAFDRLPDGGVVPPLPASAPTAVSFGVVLFRYKGAEFAPSDARSKQAALKKAKDDLALAKKDFAKAVQKGDPGSTDNAGRLPRGVLEPALEYILFTLKKGEVFSEPVDTPRGYWLLRRVK